MSVDQPWTWISTAVCAAGLLALLVAEARGSSLGKWLSKPLASLGFLSIGFSRLDHGDPVPTTMLVGLTLCLVGDVLLIPKDKRAFLAGIGAFMAGHLAYVLTFAARGVDADTLFAAALVVLALAGAVVGWLLPRMAASASKMRAPVLAYILVISAMLSMAVATWAWRRADALLAGAALFFLSDLLVARNRFVAPGFVNRLIGLPLYYTAQCLLAWTV